MKKTLKVLLSLVLALSLVLSLAACDLGSSSNGGSANGGEAKQETELSKEDAEKGSKEAVTEALDAACSYNFDKMSELGLDVGDEFSGVSGLDALIDEAKANMCEEIPDELSPYETDLVNMFDIAFAPVVEYMEKFDYEIKTFEEKGGDSYIYTVKLTVPDVSVIESFDIENIMSFTDETALTNIILELANEGKITETTTEEEAMSLVFEEVGAMIAESLEDELSSEEVYECEAEVCVVYENGKWVIDDANCDFSELANAF